MKQQAEERIKAMEMLLDAEFIRGGRYFLKSMGPRQPPKYFDIKGNEITADRAIAMMMALAGTEADLSQILDGH